MSQKRLSAGKKLLVSILSILQFVAIAEVVVRVLSIDTQFQNRLFVLNRALDYPDVFLKDRALFWRFRPGQTITSMFFAGKTYHINSFGLRGEEIDAEKTRPRILAIGNSCTFGWSVADGKTYVEQLDSLLNQEYEVINCGIPGYTCWQGRLFFENELLSLNPDIILVCFAWNDHWAAANQIADKDQQFPPQIILDAQNLLNHLHSYRLLKKGLLSTIEENPDSLFNRQTPVYRVGLDDFATNLIDICHVARVYGIQPYLLTAPIASLQTYYPPGSRSPMHAYHQLYNAVIRQVAESEGAGLVDLAAEFDRNDDLFDDAAQDPIHYNARGHRVAAETIFHVLQENTADSKSEH